MVARTGWLAGWCAGWRGDRAGQRLRSLRWRWWCAGWRAGAVVRWLACWLAVLAGACLLYCTAVVVMVAGGAGYGATVVACWRGALVACAVAGALAGLLALAGGLLARAGARW